MEQRVSAVVRSCFFHIRSLSKVRPYITYKAASSIAVCLILSKLDYCNSLLSGLPQKQIKRLQAVQNAAARTVMKCKKTDHITPILRQLHWLPIQKRIRHKILCHLPVQFMITPPSTSLIFSKKCNPSRLLRSASRFCVEVFYALYINFYSFIHSLPTPFPYIDKNKQTNKTKQNQSIIQIIARAK